MRSRQLARLVLALVVLLSLFVASWSGEDPPIVLAQQAARLEVAPSSGPPGATVTLRGSGWPPGASLTARMYRASDVGGAGADLGMAFLADSGGAFTMQGVIPRTLFGMGSRGNVEVIPGAYTIVVRPGPELSASAPFTVVAPAPGQVPAALPRTGHPGGLPQALWAAGFAATCLGLLLRRRPIS